MLVCVLQYILHTRPRVQQAPGIPCALFSLGENELQSPGGMRRGNAEVCDVVIPGRAKREPGIHNPK